MATTLETLQEVIPPPPPEPSATGWIALVLLLLLAAALSGWRRYDTPRRRLRRRLRRLLDELSHIPPRDALHALASLLSEEAPSGLERGGDEAWQSWHSTLQLRFAPTPPAREQIRQLVLQVLHRLEEGA